MGQALAHKLGWTFLDTDRLIEANTENTVADLFREKGEPYFRALESKVLQECSKKTRVVIATGGGAPAHHGNMELMLESGLTVWLNPDLAEIAKRLRAESEHRPLLEQTDIAAIQARLSELMEQRRLFYQTAALIMGGIYTDSDLYLAVSQAVT